MWVCNNCGHTNGDNANHCKYCNAQKNSEHNKHLSVKIPVLMTVALILVVSSFWVHEKTNNILPAPLVSSSYTEMGQDLVPESLDPSPGLSEVAKSTVTPEPTPSLAIASPVPSLAVIATTTPKPTKSPTPTPVPTIEPTPSRNDLDRIGSKIDYPSESNFLKKYRYATIKAPRSGWSVYGFKHLLREDNATNPDYNIEDGTRVTVLSSNVYGFVCCILEHKNIACWINEKYVDYSAAWD